MSSGTKTLLVLAGIALVVFLGAFSAFVILVRDESSPPDDSDLVLVRPTIPDDQNAWTYYAQAGEKLRLPKEGEDADWPPAPAAPAPADGKAAEATAKTEPDEPPPNVRDRWDAMVNGTAWEQPLVDEVLKRNAEALALWEKGLAVPECLLPEVKTFDDNVSGVYSLLGLSNLAIVRARNHTLQGNAEAALDDAVRLVRCGQHVEGGRGMLVCYLVGLTIKQMGLGLMGEMAHESRLSPHRLRRCAADLAHYQAIPQDIAAAWRAEYTVARNCVDTVASGSPLFFKPNRTRRLIAEMYRDLIAAAPKQFADMPDFGRFGDAFRQEQDWAGGNHEGGRLLCLIEPCGRGLYKVKCQTNVEVAVTRTLLAMKAYKLDKGRLPETLEQLVPEYLDAVPIDDFDGKPIHYNPAKRIIYSVGEDLRDGGGMTWDEFVAARRREQGLDRPDADPDALKWFDEDYCKNPQAWDMPDPAFAIEF